MSQYSPQGRVQDRSGDILADAISGAFDKFLNARRQKKLDAQQSEAHDLSYYDKGGRRGTPPADPGATITFPGEPNIPRSLSDRAPTPGPTSSLDPNSFNAALADQFARGGPAPRPTPEPAAPGTEQPEERPMLTAPIHPGAFDPASGTFGGSALQFAVAKTHARGARTEQLGSPGRYTTIDDSHYIDETATPAAERERDRETQMQLAAAFRNNDIITRGDQTRKTEDVRFQGREKLRKDIDAAHLTEIGARGAEQRKTSEQHDTRVTKRLTEAPSRAMTEGQRQANAMKMADGVIAAANGSYDDAVDWLNNTDEGKDAATRGLTKSHLYAALGKFIGEGTKAGVRLETGAGGMDPKAAAEAVESTRREVSKGRSPKHGSPSVAAPGASTALPTSRRMLTQDQYDKAIAAGHDDATIAASYDIPSTVKRKKK